METDSNYMIEVILAKGIVKEPFEANQIAVDVLKILGDVETAEEQLRTAIIERKRIVRRASAAGLTTRELAYLTGISHQRVSQLLNSD